MISGDKVKRGKIFMLLTGMVVFLLGGCAAEGAGSASSFAVQAADSAAAVPGDRICDGTYGIAVESDNGSFAIEMCNLSVRDGKMTAALTVKGSDYLYAFMGTPEHAGTDEKNRIKAVPGKGTETFLVPVAVLNRDIPFAVLKDSTRKWVPVTLRFKSSSLPAEALKSGSMKSISDLGLSDGAYTVGARLSGGSGKASVASPAVLTVSDGRATVKVEFSSPYFDYVLLDSVKYIPVNDTGNSVFEIPVKGLDYEIPITADTAAMSKAHEIQYTIFFDSSEIHKRSDGGQE
jgi:hypothetical protein